MKRGLPNLQVTCKLFESYQNQSVVLRLQSLAARLPRPRRLYLETADGVQLPGPGRGGYWIISRGLCRFFRVPLLAGAARASQLDAIALEIRRLSPFEKTGSHFHFASGFAGIWLWDERATHAAAASVGVDIARLRVLPEPALLPSSQAGLRLIEGLEGVEGQYWSDGELIASRWWLRLPDERAWLFFQRGASVAPEQISPGVPVPLRLDWLERPWTKTRSSGAFDLARLDTRAMAAVVALLVVAGYGYYAAQYLHTKWSLASLSAEIDTRSAAIEPILRARSQALDNLTAIQSLNELKRFPGQLALMARVAEVLPATGARLDDWLYDRGQLELSIAGDQPLDVVRLVRSLEASGYFNTVAAERTANNNTLRLRAGVVTQ